MIVNSVVGVLRHGRMLLPTFMIELGSDLRVDLVLNGILFQMRTVVDRDG